MPMRTRGRTGAVLPLRDRLVPRTLQQGTVSWTRRPIPSQRKMRMSHAPPTLPQRNRTVLRAEHGWALPPGSCLHGNRDKQREGQICRGVVPVQRRPCNVDRWLLLPPLHEGSMFGERVHRGHQHVPAQSVSEGTPLFSRGKDLLPNRISGTLSTAPSGRVRLYVSPLDRWHFLQRRLRMRRNSLEPGSDVQRTRSAQ